MILHIYATTIIRKLVSAPGTCSVSYTHLDVYKRQIVESLQTHLNIDETELAVLYQANTPEQILTILEKHELRIGNCAEKQISGDESAFILSPRHLTNIVAYDQEASSYDEHFAGKPVSHVQLDEFISLVHPPAKVLDLGTGFGQDLSLIHI